MSKTIRIRDVPDPLRRAAEARAAREGVSLSDFALRALERELDRRTMAEIGARVRALPPLEHDVDAAGAVREERDRRPPTPERSRSTQ